MELLRMRQVFLGGLSIALAVMASHRRAWAQCETQQIANDAILGQNHFSAGAISETFAAARGTVYADDGQSLIRSLYVLQRSKSGWKIAWDIDNPNGVGTPSDGYGKALSLRGDLLLVGAPDVDAVDFHSGAAYLFHITQAGWSPLTTLIPSDGAFNDNFGWSVAIDGNQLVVGARGDEVDGYWKAGSGYVFSYSEPLDGWVEAQKLTAFSLAEFQLFGQSVAIHDDVLVVGAHGNNNGMGSVFVFRHDGDLWTEEVELTAFDATPDARFGEAVDIAGDVIAVGATQAFLKFGNAPGGVYLFRYVDSQWVFEQKIVPGSLIGCCPHFGSTVGLTDDGNTLLAGAFIDDGGAIDAGSIHIARHTPDGWIVDPPIYSATAEPNGMFDLGDVHGDVALASGHDGPGDTGLLHVIEGILGIDCNDNGQADACDIFYGVSGDADGDRIPDECDSAADINNDGVVGAADLAALLAQWGQCPPPEEESCDADIAPQDGDATVNVLDLAALLASWS
jgi:hypothetical protein